ncbi:hypothetical protein [Tardiphaga sp.]|uniref:hypothetical protein n=1 Tax=Tardiphaga sp. TaxID=1926292 RepID=UPI00261351AA|nr:hypothetical protein [Tardiphaga sp.]MDB5620520.1 hypothetical protein [Tardiphaga sp.]
MTSPLAGSLARTIGAAFNTLFLPAVLVRDVPQTGGDPADPLPPLAANFPCRAVVEAYSQFYRANNLVQAGERKVLILATSVGVKPTAGDRVTIQGITFAISEVSTDPATAIYECKGAM